MTKRIRENLWHLGIVTAWDKYNALRILRDESGVADALGTLMSYIGLLERELGISVPQKEKE